jgi:hypothetical protein
MPGAVVGEAVTLKRKVATPPEASVMFLAVGFTPIGPKVDAETVTLPLKLFWLPSETEISPDPPGARMIVSGISMNPKSLNPTMMKSAAVWKGPPVVAFTRTLYWPGGVDAVVVIVSDVPTIPLAGRDRLELPSIAVGQFGPGQTPAGPCIVRDKVIVAV